MAAIYMYDIWTQQLEILTEHSTDDNNHNDSIIT